jgi:hypothetical protein
MDKYKKLADYLKGNGQINNIPLFNATVKSIEGESCTITIDDLELDEVRLKATINGNANKIIVTPAVGSMVLVGSLTGDLKDLAIIATDEIEKLEYEQDGLKLLIDSTDGKISISNTTISVKDVFQQLTDLLKAFKVYTPAGPSGTALPDVVLLINAFETAFKAILK